MHPGYFQDASGAYFEFQPDATGHVYLEWFGGKNDGVAFNFGSTYITSGSSPAPHTPNTLRVNNSGGPFANAKAGMVVMVNGAGPAGVPLVTTLATITDAFDVEMAAASSNAMSGALCYGAFGTDNYPAYVAAQQMAEHFRALIQLRFGIYMTSQTWFGGDITAASQLGCGLVGMGPFHTVIMGAMPMTISGGVYYFGVANGQVTFSTTVNPSVNDTITINGVVFTWKAASGSASQITIGANAQASAANLVAIVNAYGAGVGCTAFATTNVVTLTATAPGNAGQSVTLAESSSATTLSGATLTLNQGAYQVQGQWKDWGGFTIRPAAYYPELDTNGVTTSTAATGILVSANASFASMRAIRCEGWARGIDTLSQGAFSCDMARLDLINNWDRNVLSFGLGTGNVTANVYASATGLQRAHNLITIKGADQGVGLQLNTEHTNVLESPLDLTDSPAFDLIGWNQEGIRCIDETTYLGDVVWSLGSPTIGNQTRDYYTTGGFPICPGAGSNVFSNGGTNTAGGGSITYTAATGVLLVTPDVGETTYGLAAAAGGLGILPTETYTLAGATDANTNASFVCTGVGCTGGYIGQGSNTSGWSAIMSGAPTLSTTFYSAGVATFGGVGTANDTLTINGQAITLVNSGATGFQANIAGTAALTAANVQAVINANPATFNAAATLVGAVLTITASVGGSNGQIAVAKSSTAITLSGLTGGATGNTAMPSTIPGASPAVTASTADYMHLYRSNLTGAFATIRNAGQGDQLTIRRVQRICNRIIGSTGSVRSGGHRVVAASSAWNGQVAIKEILSQSNCGSPSRDITVIAYEVVYVGGTTCVVVCHTQFPHFLTQGQTIRLSGTYPAEFTAGTGALGTQTPVVRNVLGPKSFSFAINYINVNGGIGCPTANSSGTITFGGVGTPNDTVTINGVTITLVASGASGSQINIGGSATATGANLATYLNAHLATFGIIGAQNISGVVSIVVSAAGSTVTMTKSSTAITLSGATTFANYGLQNTGLTGFVIVPCLQVVNTVARVSATGIATIVFTGLLPSSVTPYQYMRYYSSANGSFSVSGVPILSRVDSGGNTTITFRNPGADVSPTADTHGAFTVWENLEGTVNMTSPSYLPNPVIEFGPYYSPSFLIAAGTINAGASQTTNIGGIVGAQCLTVAGTLAPDGGFQVPDWVDVEVRGTLAPGLMAYGNVDASVAGQLDMVVNNVTASNITFSTTGVLAEAKLKRQLAA